MTKVNVILAETGKQNANMMRTLDLLNVGVANIPVREISPGQFSTPPMAVAVFLEVDFTKAGRPVDLVLELVDHDGRAVEVMNRGQPEPLVARQTLRPKATLGPVGTPARANVLAIFPGLPLFADAVYIWKVTVDGEHKEDWEASLYVTPLDSPPPVDQQPEAQ